MVDLYETVLQHPEHFKQLKCNSMLFTQYECLQQTVFQDLFSKHNYIAYIISGKRTFHLPGEKHIMTEGKCIFAKKGAWIAEKDPGKGWCVLVFFIPDEYLRQFVKESRSNLPFAIRKPETNQQMIDLEVNEITHRFFYSMIPYFDQSPSVPEGLLELKFRELLFNLLINPENAALLAWLYTLTDSIKQPLQQVMEANYMFNLSLIEYARIANRSLASFKREFQTIYMTTPGKWLIQKRLEYATLMLSTSSKNINEIVFESGFENPTHFSRLFKIQSGMTPTAFRNQKQKNSS